MSMIYENDETLETYPNYVWFAIVVDGEFTGKIGITENPSAALAGLRSNPTMIEMSQEQAVDVRVGWVHDGTTFLLPAGE